MLDNLISTLTRVIVNPLLALLFASALLVFAWGIVEFMLGLNTDDHEKRESGKRHMIYGVMGMFLMTSAWAVVKIIAGTVCDPSLTSCSKILNHI